MAESEKSMKWKGSYSIIALIWIFLAMMGCGKPAFEGISANSSVSVQGADAVFATKPYEGRLSIRYLHLEHKEQTGDAIIIHSPDGKIMLIDAGIPETGKIVVETLDQLGISKIDIALNTHPHPDHIGGFDAVFSKKKVGHFYRGNLDVPEWSSFENTMMVARREKIPTSFLQDGDEFQLGKHLKFEVINPKSGELPNAAKGLGLEEVNNGSIVLRLTYNDQRFLFTGDIHRSREAELAQNPDRLKADFMDAPHHGISTSSSQVFIKAVSPKNALLSQQAAYLNFETMLAYKKNNIETYATGRHGHILIVSDGKSMEVITEKEI